MNGAIWTTGADSKLRRINSSAKVQEMRFLPVSSPAALVYDQTNLWVTDGFVHLYKIDAGMQVTAIYTWPDTGTTRSSQEIADLAYDMKSLWASLPGTNEICSLQLLDN
jgi:hypothetical protein